MPICQETICHTCSFAHPSGNLLNLCLSIAKLIFIGVGILSSIHLFLYSIYSSASSLFWKYAS